MQTGLLTMMTAAAVLLLAPAASAATVVATTANAGGTVSISRGDTLDVKLPGLWSLSGDATPQLVLQTSDAHGKGAHARSELTFTAEDAGSTELTIENKLTKAKLSMQVDVMAPGR